MKIGIVTEYFFPTLGGITENIYHFSREFLKHGHDFRVITGFRGKLKGIDPEVQKRMIFVGRNIPVFFNGSCGRLTVGMNLTERVKEIFQREKFDIVHLHSPLFPTLPTIACMQSEAPVVGTFHTCTDNRFYYRFYGRHIQEMLNRMTGRIAVSECCARDNQRFFEADFDIIPNGVDVAWWSKSRARIKKFDDGKINILFLGRPDTRNGLDTLIAAFARVHRTHKNTRLIIVGDGPLSFYFKSLVPTEVRNAVIFEGAADGTRPAYTASADVFCFAPTIASFGITILEGMSAGKAIIASDIEAFRALVKNGESALLVKPADEDALTRAMERLIEDKTLREKLGANAFAHVDKYDWKNVAEMQIKCYENILRQ